MTIEVEPAPAATAEDLAKILGLAREQVRIRLVIEKHEEEVKKLKLGLKQVTEKDLPEAMRAADLTTFDCGGGWSVILKPFVAASISEANRGAAHEWLDEHGMGGLIKRTIIVYFGKDEDRWAKKFMADLAKRKRPLDVERKETVHSGSLTAAVKEQIAKALEEGKDPRAELPFDLLGVYQAEVAELVAPKKARAVEL